MGDDWFTVNGSLNRAGTIRHAHSHADIADYDVITDLSTDALLLRPHDSVDVDESTEAIMSKFCRTAFSRPRGIDVYWELRSIALPNRDFDPRFHAIDESRGMVLVNGFLVKDVQVNYRLHPHPGMEKVALLLAPVDAVQLDVGIERDDWAMLGQSCVQFFNSQPPLMLYRHIEPDVESGQPTDPDKD